MDKEKKQEFKNLFYRKVLTELSFFERKRLRVLFGALLLGFIGVLAGVLMIIFMPKTGARHEMDLPFFIIVVSISFAFYIIKRFKDSVKSKIYPIIFKIFSLNYSRITSSFVNLIDFLDNTSILGGYSSVDTDDVFSGIHHDLPFELVETTITNGHGKNRHTIFNGIIFVAKSNKKFNKITVIKNDVGILNALNGGNFERVKLEDVEFEKIFEVYGQDQVESRYLLTTSFMDRLLNYTKMRRCNLKVTFYDDKIIFFIPKLWNSFEVPILDSLFKIEYYMKVIEEVYDLLEIIDALMLEQNIGL